MTSSHLPTMHPAPQAGISAAYTKMSSDTTNMVYSRLQRLDVDIDTALARIKAANEELVAAYHSVQHMYGQRVEVAAELDRLAPSNWTPPEPEMCMTATPPYPVGYEPPKPSRWHREYPL